jgi:hypothetical protein
LTKIAIVHFQPLEKYPPVMNVINSICTMENVGCNVYTTHHKNNNWFAANKINIHRVAKQYQNSLLRYWCYIQFNSITFFSLLFKQPKVVVAYETYSVLPVYLYKKLFLQCKIVIHYHEYTSKKEIKNASAYFKILHFFEKKLYSNCEFISQTNDDRLQLFLKDYPNIKKDKTFTVPNLPPENWIEYSKLNKLENNSGIIKLVHVGAIGLDTMYVKEMLDWVKEQKGKYSIDFYTSNISSEAKVVFDTMQNNYVRLLGPINYFELPQVLINYDIGVTIYNGHIPNYIYNVPNKVYEYLACGLEVWYSKDLVSTDKLNKVSNSKNPKLPEFLKQLNCNYEAPENDPLLTKLFQNV